MDCPTFESWLDDGRPVNGAAEEHAASCASCQRKLDAASAVEAALGQRFASVPPGFTDRVIAQLGDRKEVRVSIPQDPESPWPWYLQILMEPTAALGLGLGLLYALLAPSILGSGGTVPAVGRVIAETVARVPTWGGLSHSTGVMFALGSLVLVSIALYTGCQMLFQWTSRPRLH